MGMNVVLSGGTYKIYGDNLQTFDKLPVGTYEVGFSKFTGFFLTARTDLAVNEAKIYGNSEARVKKVLDSFGAVDRNFGVILSGRKGIGKTLFARLLACNAKDRGYPMIIVKEYVPGIADFLSSIEQEIVVLFDEFEKTFAESDDCKPQEEMLSMFDGLDGGKKLFVVTVNEVGKLNAYLLNRPGRFHYHFVMDKPTPAEVREYMADHLDKKYHDLIDRVVGFSFTANVTYDILRAMAFELNRGYSFEETLMDLNISKETAPAYTVKVKCSDGLVFSYDGVRVDVFSSSSRRITVYSRIGASREEVVIEFNPKDIYIDINNDGAMTLSPDKLIEYDVDECGYDMEDAADKAMYEYLVSNKPVRITFERYVCEGSGGKYIDI